MKSNLSHNSKTVDPGQVPQSWEPGLQFTVYHCTPIMEYYSGDAVSQPTYYYYRRDLVVNVARNARSAGKSTPQLWMTAVDHETQT
jgi:hypothetical protein